MILEQLARSIRASQIWSAFLWLTFASNLCARPTEIQYDDVGSSRIVGRQGFVTQVEFSEAEIIREVAIGDAEHWNVQTGVGGRTVLLKPRAGARLTNLIIVTKSRTFSFELEPTNSESASSEDYVVRVHTRTPPRLPTADELFAESDSYRKYSMAIAQDSEPIAPDRMFDTGRLTYIRFPPSAEIPAIFATVDNGGERMVNFHAEGNYLVLHEVGSRFVLRLGRMVVGLWRENPAAAEATRVDPLRGFP